MSEAYFRVESGALGPEENFLSLDDILMSQEKLPVRTETAIPRLGSFFLERSGGADPDQAIPQASGRSALRGNGLSLPRGWGWGSAPGTHALASGNCSLPRGFRALTSGNCGSASEAGP